MPELVTHVLAEIYNMYKTSRARAVSLWSNI